MKKLQRYLWAPLLAGLVAMIYSMTIIPGGVSPRDFGAKGDGKADEWAMVQAAADSAVKTGANLIIDGSFRIDKPVMVYKWTGTQYAQVSINIIGNAVMGDNGSRSRLIYTGKEGFALGIQQGKGCRIEGLNITGPWKFPTGQSKLEYFGSDFDTWKGDTTCADRRFGPLSGLVIDPFKGQYPSDSSGFRNMKEWYRGPMTRSGSTRILVEECNFSGFTACVAISINGYTQNAEILSFDGIQVSNCKAGFVFGQDQEKNNVIHNVKAWGYTHTIFAFNSYGTKTAGPYVIDLVNVAGGNINQIVKRSDGGYTMHMVNIFGELVNSFGYWNSTLNGTIDNSHIHYYYPSQLGFYPLTNRIGGVTVKNSTFRYYGEDQRPVVFNGIRYAMNVFQQTTGKIANVGDMRTTTPYDTSKYVLMTRPRPVIDIQPDRTAWVTATSSWAVPGRQVLILQKSNLATLGQAEVDSVEATRFKLKYISPGVVDSLDQWIGFVK